MPNRRPPGKARWPGSAKIWSRRQRQRVGQDHLFGQSADEPADAFRKFIAARRALCQLRRDGVPAQDRPRDQLREKENIKRRVPDVLRAGHFRR